MEPSQSILFVLNSARYFALHRLPLAKSLKGSGYRVGVVARADDPSALQKISALGLEFFDFPMHSRSVNPVREFQALFFLFRTLRSFKPCLVHSLTIKAVIFSGLLCRAMRIPMVSLIPGRGTAFQLPGLKGLLVARLATTLYRFGLSSRRYQVCFQNEEDRRFFLDANIVDSTQTHLIPGSGVDLTEFTFHPYSRDRPHRRIALVSRMLRDKGILEFIEAATKVSDSGVIAEFLLIGAPDETNPNTLTESQVRDACRGTPVRYLGHCSNVAHLLTSCDIYCLPTCYGEGIPKSILEAQACGLPVVTTDVPGCRDVVEHGVTGLLVPPRNAKALAEAFLVLLRNPERAAKLAEQAFENIKARYQVELINAAYHHIYEGILQSLVQPSQLEGRPAKLA